MTRLFLVFVFLLSRRKPNLLHIAVRFHFRKLLALHELGNHLSLNGIKRRLVVVLLRKKTGFRLCTRILIRQDIFHALGDLLLDIDRIKLIGGIIRLYLYIYILIRNRLRISANFIRSILNALCHAGKIVFMVLHHLADSVTVSIFILLGRSQCLVQHLQFQRFGNVFAVAKPQYYLVTFFHTFTDTARLMVQKSKLIAPLFPSLMALELFQNPDSLFQAYILRFINLVS